MHCNDVFEQISAALDGELSAAQRSVLDCHLASCPRCAALQEELAGPSRLLRSLDCDVPEDLSERILAALPPQAAAKKSPVVYLRRWGTLAACLVLVCCGAFALSRPAAEKKAMPEFVSAADYAHSRADAALSAEWETGSVTPAESHAVEAEPCPPAEMAQAESLLRAVRYERVDWSGDMTDSAVLLTGEEAAAYLPQDTDVSSAQYILVTLSEGSGSVSHTVEDVVLAADGSCQVRIRRDVPEVGTCDMAAWRILIEVEPVFAEDAPVILTVQ